MIVCIIAVLIVSDNAMAVVNNTGVRQTSPSPKTTTPDPCTMTKPDKYEVCEEAQCKHQAAAIEASLDRSVEPCEDFYSFSCGGWIKKKIIPDNKQSLSTTDHLFSLMINRLTELMESETRPTDLQAITNRKILFRSCMDTETIESRGISPIMDFFITHKLSWPIIHHMWSESSSDLQTQAVRYAQLGFKSIFRLKVTQDPENIGSKIFQVHTNFLTTFNRKNYYDDTKKINILRKFYTSISEILAPEQNHAQDIEDVIQYEIESSKLRYKSGEKPEKKYKRLTLRQLKEALPDNFIDIEDAVKQVLSFGSINITVTGDTPVYVEDYNMTLKTAKQTNRTRERTLMNALGFATIGHLLYFMPKNLSDIKLNLSKDLWLYSRIRWFICYTADMRFANTRMYADKYFPVEHRNDIEEMALTIQSQMQVLISLNKWMDLTTKRKALDELQAMTFEIGYPEYVLNDTFLKEYYEMFVFNESEAFENHVRIHAEYFANDMKEYNHAHTLLRFLSPRTTRPYYNEKTNVFTINAGIILPPVYDSTYLKAMNYGAIGSMIGSEIFDKKGRNRDKFGEINNWWADKSVKGYDQRADCIKKQYGAYVNEQINKTLNANMTITRDISDLVAIKAAFLAYESSVSQRGREKKLYGLNYTPEQLLFIQFAQKSCFKSRDSLELKRWKTSKITTDKYRIIGALSGFPGFVKTFQCPRGSPMNNNTYCNMW